MAFFTVGSTRIMLAVDSRSSYIVERASARPVSFPGR